MVDPTLTLLVDELNERASTLFRRDGYEQALEAAEQAYALASGPDPHDPLYPRGMAKSLIYIAGCNLNANTNAKPLPLLRQALALLDQQDDPAVRSTAYFAIGFTYLYKGNNNTGISYLRRALAIAKANNLQFETVDANIGLAGGYITVNQHQKAKRYLQEALAMALPEQTFFKALCHNNMAMVYLAEGELASAEASAHKALHLFTSQTRKAMVYDTLASIYTQKGDLPAAEEAFSWAIRINEQEQPFVDHAESYLKLAEIQTSLNKATEAEASLLAGLRMADKTNSILYSHQIHRQLAELYDQIGDPAQAFGHFKQYLHEKEQMQKPGSASKAMNRVLTQTNRLASQPDPQSELAYLASTDPLTGLLNRQQLLQAASQPFSQANAPLSIAVFSVCCASQILSEFGSLALDRIMLTFAELVLGAARSGDTCARIDEDTFAMLLQPASLLNARQLCFRVENFAQRLTYPTKAGPQGIVIRHAACQRDDSDADPQALLDRALALHEIELQTNPPNPVNCP